MSIRATGDSVFFELFAPLPAKGDQRKFEIVEGVIELVSREGLEAASLERLARQLKIRRSLVAYHFADIETLFEAAARYVTATAQAVTLEKIKKAEGWRGQIEAYVTAPFDWCARYPRHAGFMTVFYHLAERSPRFRGLHRQIRQAGRERVEGLLRMAGDPHGAGGPLDKVAAASIARSIQALITGALLDAVTCADATPLKQRRDETLQAVWSLLQRFGLGSHSAGTGP